MDKWCGASRRRALIGRLHSSQEFPTVGKPERRPNNSAGLPNRGGGRRLLLVRRNPKADARPVLSLGAARKAPHVAGPSLFRLGALRLISRNHFTRKITANLGLG